MPTIHNEDGFRFHFYPNDHNPPHLHVKYGDGIAKIEIETGEIIDNFGMKTKDLRRALAIVERNKALFLLKFREIIK
ncbi:MAG: DUF4160 domain-containing protein [Cytophagales bacterium]